VSPAEENDVLELDEAWSFVKRRSNKHWLWIALCRRTRQVVAYVIGDRSEYSCRTLWAAIPECYKHIDSCSDFWAAYPTAFPKDTHRSIGKDSGQTNHVERWNNNLRQSLSRHTQKTLSFSKSDEYHA
jgi:insertion element IS1 protein InsB